MSVILCIAVLNLALGFGLAVLLGRGPWSRYVRRYAHPKTRSADDGPRVLRSVPEILEALDDTDRQLQQLTVELAASHAGHAEVEQLREFVRHTIEQFERVAIEGREADDVEQMVTFGLASLLVLLHSSANELEAATETAASDYLGLIGNLKDACRESRGIFQDNSKELAVGT